MKCKTETIYNFAIEITKHYDTKLQKKSEIHGQ